MRHYEGPADLHMIESGRTLGLTRVDLEERDPHAPLRSWSGLAEAGLILGECGDAEIEFPSGERARVLVEAANTWNGYTMLTLRGCGEPPNWGNLG